MNNYDKWRSEEEEKSDAQADVIMAVLLGAWIFFAFILPAMIYFGVV